MAHFVTQCTDFSKSFFAFKMLHDLTVHAQMDLMFARTKFHEYRLLDSEANESVHIKTACACYMPDVQ